MVSIPVRELKSTTEQITLSKQFIKKITDSKIEKLPWTPENVVDAILACRIIDHGIPMFRTRYAGIDLKYNGTNASLFICWAGRNNVKSVLFYDIPDDDFNELKSRHDDWQYLILKYDWRDYKKAINQPVYVNNLGNVEPNLPNKLFINKNSIYK